MKNSHRLKIIQPDQRLRRVALPRGYTVDIKKKKFFSSEDVAEEQKIINLSEGGMQALIKGEVHEGDKVELILNLKDLENVKIIGKVKWVKAVPREVYYNVGIEFISVPMVFAEKISDITNDPLVVEYGKEAPKEK